jgi:hypothetical protein
MESFEVKTCSDSGESKATMKQQIIGWRGMTGHFSVLEMRRVEIAEMLFLNMALEDT